MSGPFAARMKYGKPTDTISNVKMWMIGASTSCGFQLESGVMGDVHANERPISTAMEKRISVMWINDCKFIFTRRMSQYAYAYPPVSRT